MIKFENTEVVGWESAIRGMRNPMNSWEKSDSGYGCDEYPQYTCAHCGAYDDTYAECPGTQKYKIGPNDLDLMTLLRNAGTDHRKFMRMITVYVDITAPLYWWKEFDTYKVGTVANSCSTMHKIADHEFTLEDFSYEHLVNTYTLEQVIHDLNFWRHAYLIKDDLERKEYISTRFDPELVPSDLSRKDCWWQMIQLLPSSYNQKRTVMLNYEVLSNIYKSRRNHKLDEWSEHKEQLYITDREDIKRESIEGQFGFCDWIKTLPYSELITGIVPDEKEEV